MLRQLHRLLVIVRRRLRQRFTKFWQLRRNGDNQWLCLDDPVIDGIKRHLRIANRIGFEPVSWKFARIAFFCKQRMSMSVDLIRLMDADGTTETSSVELILAKRTNSAVIAVHALSTFIIPLGRLKEVLDSLFRHFRKWHAIYTIRRNIWWCSVDTVWGGMVSQLLDVLLQASKETVNVRVLECEFSPADDQRMAEFVRRCAPNLRCLRLLQGFGSGIGQSSATFFQLAQAICTCRKLRKLQLHHARSDQFPPDFASEILALPLLSSVSFGSSIERSYRFPNLHMLVVEDDWLAAISHLLDLSVLNSMQCLVLLTGSPVDQQMLSDVWRIVAKMRTPAFVDLVNFGDLDITWENVFNGLPMVYRTGADVVQFLSFGLPTLTAEELQEGLSTLPPLVQIALTPPDLATAPVKEGCYEMIEFNFASGAKIVFDMHGP